MLPRVGLPRRCPEGMPGPRDPPPPAPQHGQGGEILKPNLPQQFPFPRSETRDFHQGRAPGASLVPSGGTRSPGFRKLQGVFSLQLRVFAFLIRKVPD